jgi:hypothetical protein
MALMATQPPLQWYRVFPGVKQAGAGLDHSSPSSAEVKERVEIYLYSSLGLRGLFWS